MRRSKAYLPFVLFAIVYILLSLLLPPDQEALKRYDISTGQLRLLLISIIIPILAIWGAAAYGYVHIRRYAELVDKSGEGSALKKLATGLGVLAYSLPVTQITSTFLNYEARVHPGFFSTSRIINNYLSIAFSFAAFMFINRGATELVLQLKSTLKKSSYDVVMFVFIILSAIYSYLVFTNSALDKSQSYALPDFFIVTTVVIPFLIIWYFGFIATMKMHYFQTRVKGLLYRSSLWLLTIGIAGVIVTSIVLQFLTALSNQLRDLNLGALLLIIYVLLFVMSVGYILIAAGSKRMAKIEEV